MLDRPVIRIQAELPSYEGNLFSHIPNALQFVSTEPTTPGRSRHQRHHSYSTTRIREEVAFEGVCTPDTVRYGECGENRSAAAVEVWRRSRYAGSFLIESCSITETTSYSLPVAVVGYILESTDFPIDANLLIENELMRPVI